MSTTKKSIIGTQCILILLCVSFAYTAHGEEDLSPQDRFTKLQEKAEVQRIEFEARKNTQKNTFRKQAEENEKELNEKRLEFQKQTVEKKERMQEKITEQKGEFNELSEEERARMKEKIETRKNEARAKITDQKHILKDRQQERIKNLSANVSNRMEAVIARLRQITDRFQKRMDTLKERGVDTTAAQITLDEASGHLDKAQVLISGIDVLIAEVIGSESPREAWATTKTRYIEIKNHIKLAHTALRTSLQLLKDAVKQAENPEPATEEITNPSEQEAPTN